MTTYLLFDDTIGSPELRHELETPVMDALVWVEHEGKRIVTGSALEQVTFKDAPVDDYWLVNSLGMDELTKDESWPQELLWPEMVLRMMRRLRVDRVRVPPTFRLMVADYLRARGVEVEVDAHAFEMRRRVKSSVELEGTERAQRAADVAMQTAARMLREAEPAGEGRLRFEGETLTAEWIREAMLAELVALGADTEEIIVQSGDACLDGHDLGHGPIVENQSCIIDCFPRDRSSGAYTDMTRTFVPGVPSDELASLHNEVRAALEVAWEAIRPGSAEAHARVTEYFHERGRPTYAHHDADADEPLQEGFFHSLGHGVGLQVHEKPLIGRRAEELIDGDVVAIEPGLYFPGIGGVRLEDTVLVTKSGARHFTEPHSYDLAP